MTVLLDLIQELLVVGVVAPAAVEFVVDEVVVLVVFHVADCGGGDDVDACFVQNDAAADHDVAVAAVNSLVAVMRCS